MLEMDGLADLQRSSRTIQRVLRYAARRVAWQINDRLDGLEHPCNEVALDVFDVIVLLAREAGW